MIETDLLPFCIGTDYLPFTKTKFEKGKYMKT